MRKFFGYFLIAPFLLFCFFAFSGCEFPKILEFQNDQQIESLVTTSGDSTKGSEISFFEMKPEDCLPGEKYDQGMKICYFDCQNDEECAKLDEQLQEQLDAFMESFDDELGEVFQELDPKAIQPEIAGKDEVLEEPERDEAVETVTGQEKRLASYQVLEDKIVLKEGDDKKEYQDIWKYFVGLFPLERRSLVSTFEIFSDGKEGTMAAVVQDGKDPSKWILAIDPEDAYKNGQVDKKELTYSLLHEFGHLLTLNSTQVPPDEKLYFAPGEEAYKSQLNESINFCRPRYFTGEGCSNKTSYINVFVERFWADIFHEHKAIGEIKDDLEYERKMGEFYEKYQDRFVSSYAVTDPGEDIAETWTVFILKEKPKSDSFVDKKVSFFYEFKELVDLRDRIRKKIR